MEKLTRAKSAREGVDLLDLDSYLSGFRKVSLLGLGEYFLLEGLVYQVAHEGIHLDENGSFGLRYVQVEDPWKQKVLVPQSARVMTRENAPYARHVSPCSVACLKCTPPESRSMYPAERCWDYKLVPGTDSMDLRYERTDVFPLPPVEIEYKDGVKKTFGPLQSWRPLEGHMVLGGERIAFADLRAARQVETRSAGRALLEYRDLDLLARYAKSVI